MLFRSVLGLALAIALTIASFWVARTHILYGPSVPVALVALAVAQMGIHLVFFLHITTAPDNANNVLALAFGILSGIGSTSTTMESSSVKDTRLLTTSNWNQCKMK